MYRSPSVLASARISSPFLAMSPAPACMLTSEKPMPFMSLPTSAADLP